MNYLGVRLRTDDFVVVVEIRLIFQRISSYLSILLGQSRTAATACGQTPAERGGPWYLGTVEGRVRMIFLMVVVE